MAWCCAKEECKAQSGPCGHEKTAGLVILVVAAAFVLWKMMA